MPERRSDSPRTQGRAAAPKAGSRSPKHRGYRADAPAAGASAAGAKKPRWSAGQREAQGKAPERPRGGESVGRSFPSRGDAPHRAERSARQDGGFRNDRGDSPRGARPDRREAGFRAERPARQDGGYRAERPARQDGGYRSDDRPRTGGYGRTDDRPRTGGHGRTDGPARGARGGGYRSDDRPRTGRDWTSGPRTPRDDTRGDARGGEQRRDTGRDWYPGGRSAQRDDSRSGGRDAGRGYDRDAARPARRSDDHFGGERAPRFGGDRDRVPRFGGDRDRAPRFGGDRARSERPRYDAPAPRHLPEVDDVVLERLEAQAVDAATAADLGFAELGLGTNIVATLAELGAERPFPIQAATIPEALAGRDVLGRGRTGSGKTIAFGAPLVERLLAGGGGKKREHGRAPRALILAPTRELALQIDATVQPIAQSVGLFTTQIYGGVPQGRQVGALQRGVDIIIGTPGRIEDLVQQRKLDLSRIEITVLDEADHMCELGFLEPVQRILEQTRAGGQRLLFSATLDKGVATLVDQFLKEPAVYEVAGEDQASATIDHRVFVVEQSEKAAIVEELTARDDKTLVFVRTRAFAEQLADQLDDADIRTVSLHGDLNQARRTRNLEKLTSGRAKVLVATDVAARGIHVDDIGLVIQADIPEEYKTYLHRSGRTGRAGREGTVVTLVTKQRLRKLMELLGRAEITVTPEHVRAGKLPPVA